MKDASIEDLGVRLQTSCNILRSQHCARNVTSSVNVFHREICWACLSAIKVCAILRLLSYFQTWTLLCQLARSTTEAQMFQIILSVHEVRNCHVLWSCYCKALMIAHPFPCHYNPNNSPGQLSGKMWYLLWMQSLPMQAVTLPPCNISCFSEVLSSLHLRDWCRAHLTPWNPLYSEYEVPYFAEWTRQVR